MGSMLGWQSPLGPTLHEQPQTVHVSPSSSMVYTWALKPHTYMGPLRTVN